MSDAVKENLDQTSPKSWKRSSSFVSGSNEYLLCLILDECDEQARRSLLAQLERLDHSISRCFLTSRHHLLDMAKRYEKYPQIEINAKDQDIRQFLQIKIEEDEGLSDDEEQAVLK
jgi:hypothetical protein